VDEKPWFRFYEQGVPRSVPVPEITLPEALDRAAKRSPDRVALRFFLDARLPTPTLTYRQLQEQTLRFATGLFQMGVRKGDAWRSCCPTAPSSWWPSSAPCGWGRSRQHEPLYVAAR